jgi:phage terminase Nu1 subunit (DNA packaging protein)
MAIGTFEEELRRARIDLAAASAEVMALVRERKAFGELWEAANERESIARRKIASLLDTLVVRSENF